MTAFAATAAYEWRMQIRKPAIWIATALPYLVYVGFAVLGTDSTGLQRYRQETDPKVWMVDALGWFAPFLPIVFGIVLADRLVRDRRLRVAPLLDVTPANRAVRLVGKYLGVCAATAAPPVLIYLAVAAAFAVWRGRPAALLWGLAVLGAVVLPLLLLAGALSFLGPQLMPTPLFRVLVVGLWFWAGATEVGSQLPSLADTVLSLTMDYPLKVFFDSETASGGPSPGAALNFLRPQPTVATAVLSLALMVGIAAALLAAAGGLYARNTD
jgi:ABC-type Na+ efflux pump permease subunit